MSKKISGEREGEYRERGVKRRRDGGIKIGQRRKEGSEGEVISMVLKIEEGDIADEPMGGDHA